MVSYDRIPWSAAVRNVSRSIAFRIAVVENEMMNERLRMALRFFTSVAERWLYTLMLMLSFKSHFHFLKCGKSRNNYDVYSAGKTSATICVVFVFDI